MPPTHIFVTAPDGRMPPLHPSDASGGLGLVHAEHGKVTRVKYSAEVRRAITDGDLIPTTIGGTPVKDIDKAAAEEPLESGGPHVTPEDRKAVAAVKAAEQPKKTDGGSQ